jgi:hypothetical protein
MLVVDLDLQGLPVTRSREKQAAQHVRFLGVHSCSLSECGPGVDSDLGGIAQRGVAM